MKDLLVVGLTVVALCVVDDGCTVIAAVVVSDEGVGEEVIGKGLAKRVILKRTQNFVVFSPAGTELHSTVI